MQESHIPDFTAFCEWFALGSTEIEKWCPFSRIEKVFVDRA